MAVQHLFEESDSRLAALVQEINQTLETRTLQTALQVGALVVAAIFDGDLSRVTDTSRGSMSYRKLAAHPDLAVSYSKLWQMVQVTAQHGDLPDEARGLSYTHQRALLHAPAETVRNELAVQAATERWPSRKLEQRLREVRVKRSKGGRPPTATFMRALDQLEAGADPNAAGHDGATAMGEAASRDDITLLEILYNSGADLDIGDAGGRTPLMQAAARRRNAAAEAAHWLMKNGARIDTRADNGMTAADYADKEGNVDLAEDLRAAGRHEQ